MAITKSTIAARLLNVIECKRDMRERIDPLAKFRKRERFHANQASR
jgi:hypothetical protein